ncbi:MAG: RNA chaperone Hfq [Alphaproteobacteria bacterium]|nr:MAG: RNA chaperone Hfq [Alphaproteobacteria bacterium]
MTSQPQAIKKEGLRVDLSCQDSFLLSMKDKCVTVFLINGVKLKGNVAEYDDVSLLLSRDDSVQLIYKNAISTMMPYVERV